MSFVFVAFLARFPIGFTIVQADELPADASKITSLTPDQGRKLAKEFPGTDLEINRPRFPGCLSPNGLKSLWAETAEALVGHARGPGFLDGLTRLSGDTAEALAQTVGRGSDGNGLRSRTTQGRPYEEGMAGGWISRSRSRCETEEGVAFVVMPKRDRRGPARPRREPPAERRS